MHDEAIKNPTQALKNPTLDRALKNPAILVGPSGALKNP
jgi:hypothetical protein